MSPSQSSTALDAVEADNRAALYKARWDESAASGIMPQLIPLLDSEDRDTLLRTMGAFVTIGPLASGAAVKIAGHLRSSDESVFRAAAIALACVSLKEPQLAIAPLVDAAKTPGREKYVMMALIEFGEAAKAAAPVFLSACANRSASIRRLALRGLAAIGADDEVLSEVFRKATADRSKEVRAYASKVIARRIAR